MPLPQGMPLPPAGGPGPVPPGLAAMGGGGAAPKPPGAGGTGSVAAPGAMPGAVNQGLHGVKLGLEALQKALPQLPMGSEIHSAVLKALGDIGKHLEKGGMGGGDASGQIQQLIELARNAKLGGGAPPPMGAGAAPPPPMGGMGAPPPPGGGAMMGA